VRGIPDDQRGIRTIAKVGGLVGKTVAIDESTRFNPEYVRIKIACRDVMEIPESTEGILGMYIFDFFYEREESEDIQKDKRKSGVRIEEQGAQPSPKKMKTTHATPQQKDRNLSQQETAEGGGMDGGKGRGRSAPSKFNKEKWVVDEEEAIPATTYEPSGSSDDFQVQVDKMLEEGAKSSKRNDFAGLARCEMVNVEKFEGLFSSSMPSAKSGGDKSITQSNDKATHKDGEIQGNTTEQDGLNLLNLTNPCERMIQEREERRWSERIMRQNEELCQKEEAAGKTPLGGNNTFTNSFSVLDDDEIMERDSSMGVILNMLYPLICLLKWN
jgi:hypothetical protein